MLEPTQAEGNGRAAAGPEAAYDLAQHKTGSIPPPGGMDLCLAGRRGRYLHLVPRLRQQAALAVKGHGAAGGCAQIQPQHALGGHGLELAIHIDDHLHPAAIDDGLKGLGDICQSKTVADERQYLHLPTRDQIQGGTKASGGKVEAARHP